MLVTGGDVHGTRCCGVRSIMYVCGGTPHNKLSGTVLLGVSIVVVVGDDGCAIGLLWCIIA